MASNVTVCGLVGIYMHAEYYIINSELCYVSQALSNLLEQNKRQ